MTMDDLAYISFVPKSVMLMLGGKFAFQNSLGYLIGGRKFMSVICMKFSLTELTVRT